MTAVHPRTTALCCQCGQIRTVSSGYYGRRRTDPFAEFNTSDSSRSVVTLRCEHCRAQVSHAVLRVDPERDYAEESERQIAREAQELIARGACPDPRALARSLKRWVLWVTEADGFQRRLLAAHGNGLGLVQVDRTAYQVAVFLAPDLGPQDRVVAFSLAHRAVCEPALWPWKISRYYRGSDCDPECDLDPDGAWVALLNRTGRRALELWRVPR